MLVNHPHIPNLCICETFAAQKRAIHARQCAATLISCQNLRNTHAPTSISGPEPPSNRHVVAPLLVQLAQYLCVSVLRFAGKLLGSDGENTNGASKTAAVYDRRDAAASPASL